MQHFSITRFERGRGRRLGIEKSKYNVQITNRVQRRGLSGYSPLSPIEDSQDTTSEFQSTVFCFPNQRSEKPFGLLQIRKDEPIVDEKTWQRIARPLERK